MSARIDYDLVVHEYDIIFNVTLQTEEEAWLHVHSVRVVSLWDGTYLLLSLHLLLLCW